MHWKFGLFDCAVLDLVSQTLLIISLLYFRIIRLILLFASPKSIKPVELTSDTDHKYLSLV